VAEMTSNEQSGGALGRASDVMFAVGVAIVLTTLLIPLPTPVLDLLLAASMALAVLTLLITLSMGAPLEFSTFPSLLLFLTLSRLSLNVASTRLILLNGYAGKIIASFGQFVVGGDIVVGLVVFVILVVIQFIVITKGAERISEVTARFTLDAMPGKQMSIDADLNAGLISEEQARERREAIVREAEFYGAMDGASKFVRGDAIAGLVIIIVNLLGGMIVGTSQGMTIGEAARTYSVLTVGDGLVSQIPAVIIATSAGFLVSKASSTASIGRDLLAQFFSQGRSMRMAAVLVGSMALLPGFPRLPFIGLGLGLFFLSRRSHAIAEKKQQEASEEVAAPAGEPEEKSVIDEVLELDRLAIEVGASLIPMIDPRKKSTVLDRIGALRRQFAKKMGLVLPLVRLRDNIDIQSNEYVVKLYDQEVARGQLEPGLFLAMDPGTASKRIKGQVTKEPVYGLPAIWIEDSRRQEAEIAGYTVIDPESVLLTHLSEIIKRHAHELLTREDVQNLVDHLRDKTPALVDNVIPDVVGVSTLQAVIENLLAEGVPVRNLTKIIEVLAEQGQRTKNPYVLTELVRKRLARTISQLYCDDDAKLAAVTFDPAVEHEMKNSLRKEGDQLVLAMAPERALAIVREIMHHWEQATAAGSDNLVLLCDSTLRREIADMLSRRVWRIPVLAYDEVVSDVQVDSVGVVAPPGPAGDAQPGLGAGAPARVPANA